MIHTLHSATNTNVLSITHCGFEQFSKVTWPLVCNYKVHGTGVSLPGSGRKHKRSPAAEKKTDQDDLESRSRVNQIPPKTSLD